MRQMIVGVLAALAVALCATTTAAAREPDHDGGGHVIAPARGGGLTGGELLAESWTRLFETPADGNPNIGGCVSLARNVLDWYPGPDGIARCSGTKRTRLFLAFGTVCTSLDPPLFPTSEAEQRACAVAGDQGFEALNITVDGGPAVNVVRSRFELVSPQASADLPDGPQTLTFVAHAWGAVVRGLRPGHHTVTMEVDNPAFGPPFGFTILLDIRRGGHG